jgi:hypothetical protein
MRRLVVAVFFLVLVGFALYGQTANQKPFVVQYVDGSVQLQLKGQTAWKTLKVKDLVPMDATIRLVKGASIEMLRDKSTLFFIKEGTYPVAGLLSKMLASSSGLSTAIVEKLRVVSGVGGAKGGGSAVGGVKAPDMSAGTIWSNGGYTHLQKLKDEKDKADRITSKDVPKEGFEIDNLQFFYWGILGGYADREIPRMYEEYKDAVDNGIRAILDSKFEGAIEHLRNAVTAAIFPEEVRRANYLLGVAYMEAGSPVRAWKIFSGMGVVNDDLEYNDFLLRKAQLQVDALQYDDSLATLKPLLEPQVKDEFGQAACLVAYHAYKGLNRQKEAADIRQKGLGIETLRYDGAGNPYAVETGIAQLLADLK